MSVYITDEDLMDKLERIEGSFWRQHAEQPYTGQIDIWQMPQTASVTHLKAHYAAYCALRFQCGGGSDEEVIGILYGNGGYSRYRLMSTGERTFIRNTSSREPQVAAEGFDLRG